jgi:hypothetical protein
MAIWVKTRQAFAAFLRAGDVVPPPQRDHEEVIR